MDIKAKHVFENNFVVLSLKRGKEYVDWARVLPGNFKTDSDCCTVSCVYSATQLRNKILYYIT